MHRWNQERSFHVSGLREFNFVHVLEIWIFGCHWKHSTAKIGFRRYLRHMYSGVSYIGDLEMKWVYLLTPIKS